MTPLIFAIVTTVVTSPDAIPPGAHMPDPSTVPLAQRSALAAGACARLATQALAPDGVPLKKLGELPPGLLEHAVWRTVGGCPVREIVFAGQTYYVQGSSPQVERIDPVAPRIKQH
jgi:hypothetical protein